MFTRRKRFANTLPGLAIGTGAFVVYCGYEYLFLKDGHHGHDDSHGHGHGEKH
jgi:NADH dehydrogenase (ubiquinone) 1 beta subcomplex subunit 3